MLSVNPCSRVSFGYNQTPSRLMDPKVLDELQRRANAFAYKDIDMEGIVHAVAPKKTGALNGIGMVSSHAAPPPKTPVTVPAHVPEDVAKEAAEKAPPNPQ